MAPGLDVVCASGESFEGTNFEASFSPAPGADPAWMTFSVEAPRDEEGRPLHDVSGNPISQEEAKLRDTDGRDYLRLYGIEPSGENDPEKDPFEGQNPKEFKAYSSLARVHVTLAAGIGLAIANGSYALGTQMVAMYEAVVVDMLEAGAGILGAASYLASHVKLIGDAKSERKSERSKQGSAPEYTPGYSTGVGQAMLPSLIFASIGFCLYETHAVTMTGGFLVAGVALAAYHFIKHRRFDF